MSQNDGSLLGEIKNLTKIVDVILEVTKNLNQQVYELDRRLTMFEEASMRSRDEKITDHLKRNCTYVNDPEVVSCYTSCVTIDDDFVQFPRCGHLRHLPVICEPCSQFLEKVREVWDRDNPTCLDRLSYS